MTDLAFPKIARAVLYLAQTVAPLVVGSVVAYSTVNGGLAPAWTAGALAVIAYLSAATGATAVSHINAGAGQPDPAEPQPASPAVEPAPAAPVVVTGDAGTPPLVISQ